MGSTSRIRMKVLLYAALLATALAQRPARIGKDGKPLLNRPDLAECMKRKSHMKVGNHNYFLSWREPWHKFEDWDWFNGRNFCRDRCMDLVSFDTKGEYEMFAEIMKRDNVTSVYTSGRKCNFQNKGCDAPHLAPINVNGWFWAGANNARIPPTDRPSPEAFWSSTGEKGERQPDNFEGIKHGPITADNNIGITIEGLQEFHDEACLAVLNNKYNDGVVWHDVACHFRSVIVCEDSDQLINLIANQEGVDVSDETEEGTNAIDIDSLPHLPLFVSLNLNSNLSNLPLRTPSLNHLDLLVNNLHKGFLPDLQFVLRSNVHLGHSPTYLETSDCHFSKLNPSDHKVV